MPLELKLQFLAFFIYLAAGVGFLAQAFLGLPGLLRPARMVFAAGAAAQLVGVGELTRLSGRLPLTSLYGFLLLLALTAAGLYLAGSWLAGWERIGLVVAPLTAGLSAIALTRTSPDASLVPALQSGWLYFHVLLAVLAYGCLAMSFAAAVVTLLRQPLEVSGVLPYSGSPGAEGSTPALGLVSRGIEWGFPLLTLVLVTGAVWAEQAWGSWWSWDPKETWALVTWLVYAAYLHLSRAQRWSQRRAAWMSLLGFLAVLFTLLGVSWLLPGLHSY